MQVLRHAPLLLAVLALAACGTEFTACREGEPCKVVSTATGGSGGTGGSPGSGAGGSTGDSAAGGGGGTLVVTSSSGGVAGEAGAPGAAGAPDSTTSSSGTGGSTGGTGGTPPVPCDGACGGATPVCNEETDTCVECLETEDCAEGVCDTDAHFCVDCLEAEDCEAPTPLCDEDQQLCVECLNNSDCTDPQASFCDAGSCTPCQTNTDCAHLSGTTVCDTNAGECVECTGTDYTSCGLSPESEPLVCNSLTRTCSDDQVEHGSGTCKPCVSDAHCPQGQMCVLQSFGDEDVGYFCFWKRGDIEHGAPASCLANGRPYVEQIVDAESIDKQTADICGLRTSTCPARNQFSTKDCAPEGTPDDSLCGFAAPNDAKCTEPETGVYRCTMRCGSPDDCPSPFDCDTNPLEPICEL